MEASNSQYNPRSAALAGRGPDAPGTAAMVYVGDQIARIADMVEAAPQLAAALANAGGVLAQIGDGLGDFLAAVAPEDRGTPHRSVRVTAGLSLADGHTEPSAITEARQQLDLLLKVMREAPGADPTGLAPTVARIRGLLG